MELGGGSKKHVENHMTWVVEILAESEVVKSCTLSLVSSLFWCHMYDVLVYKMLWTGTKYWISVYGELLN